MKAKYGLAIVICIFLQTASLAQGPAPTPVCSQTPGPEILGLYEPLQFLSPGVRVTSLVDTGAELSSIDHRLAQQLKLHTPVTRQIYVRTAHGVERRNIVEIRFKLRGHILQREFTLSNRRDMKQKVLLGRNALKGFLIDLNR